MDWYFLMEPFNSTPPELGIEKSHLVQFLMWHHVQLECLLVSLSLGQQEIGWSISSWNIVFLWDIFAKKILLSKSLESIWHLWIFCISFCNDFICNDRVMWRFLTISFCDNRVFDTISFCNDLVLHRSIENGVSDQLCGTIPSGLHVLCVSHVSRGATDDIPKGAYIFYRILKRIL